MTNVSKKNTNEPKRKKTLKNRSSEQSGGVFDDLRSVFIEDIIGVWQKDTAFNTMFFSPGLVTTIVDQYTANLPEVPEKKKITKHSEILTIGLNPNIQADLFIWGANAINHDTPFDAPLKGSSQAGEFAPYKKDKVALSHPNYLGIITTQYDGTSTTEQVIDDINKKFDSLESYVLGRGKVHIPRDHKIFDREEDKINADAIKYEIQDSFKTIQMGLGAGLAKDQQDNEENYIIQQDLLYYRVAKLSVLTLKDKLDHINEFLTIYAGKDKVGKGVPYYSETQLFLPKEITDSLKLKVKETGFKNRLFSAVLILPKTYLKTDNTYIPKIKQHLLFRHPIHYGPDDKWNLIDENKFTEIFGCSKRLIYEFNAKVRGKLRTKNNETKVCPGDLLIEHLWYGILGWTDWVYSDSVFTELSDESPKKTEKEDYNKYRPTKDGAYILHTWGVNLENDRTPHYKFCFSDLGDGKKKITDTLVYSKPNETFHENNYKKLLNNMLNVIQNAITHLTKKYENKKIQVRISKLGFGAWKWMIPPERRKYLLDYYKDSLLKMHIDDRVVITFLDYENGMCLTSEKNPENSKLQWSKNKTGPYNTDPFGPFIGNDNDVLLLVNAWDDASFIGNGGSLDPTLDGWMVTGDVKRYPLNGLNEKLLGYYAQNYSYFHNVFFQPQLLDEANWIGGEGINIDTAPVKSLEPVKHERDGFFAFIADRLEEGANVEKEQAGKKEIKKDSPPIEPLNLYERLVKKFDKVKFIYKEERDHGMFRVAERSQKKVLKINDLLKKEGDPIEALVQIAKKIDEKSIALNTALDNMDAAEAAVAEAEAAAKPHRAEIEAALAAANTAQDKKQDDAKDLRKKVVDLIKQFDDGEVRKTLDAAESKNEQVSKQFYKSFKAWEESIKDKMKEVVEQLLIAEPENQMVIDLSAAFDIKRKEEADPNRAAAERAAAERAAAAEAAERAAADRAAAERDGKKAAEGDGKGAAAEGAAAERAAAEAAAERARLEEEDRKKAQPDQYQDDQYQQQAIRQANEKAKNIAKYYQEQAEAIARGFETSHEMALYIKEKQIYIGYEYENEYTHLSSTTKEIETISKADFLSELDTSIKQLSEEIKQKTAIQEKIKPDALSMAILQAELIMMQTKKNLVTADIKKKLEPDDDYVQEVYDKIANIKDERIKAHHIISVIKIAKAMGNNAKEYYEDMQRNPHVNQDQAASLLLKNRQAKIIELAERYKPDHGDDAHKILEALLISFDIKKTQLERHESFSLYKYNQEETTKNPKFEAVAVARGFFTLDEMNSMLEEVISEKDTRPLYENKNNYYDMIPIYVKTTPNNLIEAEIEQLKTSKTSVQTSVDSAVARGEDPAINNAKLKMIHARLDILLALLGAKSAHENKDGGKNEEGLISAIQSAFEAQLLLWKETIIIARKIDVLNLDDKLNENIKLKVNEMITNAEVVPSNSILLGLKQAFNFEDLTPPIIAPAPHYDADIDEAVVKDPRLGAQYIVAAKNAHPDYPNPEFGVETWLARVNDAHKYIAEAESEDFNIDSKYKQEWVEWRTSQLKPDWKNIYKPELWEKKKKEIDVKLEQEQRQQAARLAAVLQQNKARPAADAQLPMLDQILKVVSGDAQQAVARQAVARPAVAQPVVAQPVVARPQPAVVAAANAQRFQQDARQAEMHVSSIYQEDNSSSYMFYIPIVGILIGISSMFLIK
jgi:hypothetical protein